MIRPAQNWGFLAPARSCRLNERKTMPIFFSASTCNTRKRNQGSNGAWEVSAIKIRAPLLGSREIEIPKISLGCGILAARFFPTFFVALNKNYRRF
jgi:hypothetical protein